jgi:hypothetical protein
MHTILRSIFKNTTLYKSSINKHNVKISFYSKTYFQRKNDKVQSNSINNK